MFLGPLQKRLSGIYFEIKNYTILIVKEQFFAGIARSCTCYGTSGRCLEKNG